MRFKAEVQDPVRVAESCVLDYDDLLGVITGRLSSYTVLISPSDPLSARLTISRIGDGE